LKKILTSAVLAMAVLSLAGCSGDDNGDGDNPNAPSSQPFTTTITGNVAAFAVARHAFTAPRAGSMRLTLTWTGSADLDLYLAPSTCQNLFPLGQCGVLAESDAATGNQEVVTRTVANGDNYAIFVDSFAATGANAYSIAVRIE
jgi:hypothetical protein